MTYGTYYLGMYKKAPQTIIIDGAPVVNPTDEQYEQAGYKRIVFTEIPSEHLENQHYEPKWVEQDTQIVLTWVIANNIEAVSDNELLAIIIGGEA